MGDEADGGLSRKPFVYDHVRMMIESGLYTKKEVFDQIAQECSDRNAPVLAAEQPKLRGYAAKRWALRESEERTWTGCTPNDCIDAAFETLNRAGIIALQNAGWTMTTGWEDCWAEHERKKGSGSAPRGAVFYHTQDLERGVEGNGLYLAFGAFHERDDGDPEGNTQIATEVCAVLRQHVGSELLLLHGVLHREGLEQRLPFGCRERAASMLHKVSRRAWRLSVSAASSALHSSTCQSLASVTSTFR